MRRDLLRSPPAQPKPLLSRCTPKGETFSRAVDEGRGSERPIGVKTPPIHRGPLCCTCDGFVSVPREPPCGITSFRRPPTEETEVRKGTTTNLPRRIAFSHPGASGPLWILGVVSKTKNWKKPNPCERSETHGKKSERDGVSPQLDHCPMSKHPEACDRANVNEGSHLWFPLV